MLNISFELLLLVTMTNTVFWNLKSCAVIHEYLRTGWNYCSEISVGLFSFIEVTTMTKTFLFLSVCKRFPQTGVKQNPILRNSILPTTPNLKSWLKSGWQGTECMQWGMYNFARNFYHNEYYSINIFCVIVYTSVKVHQSATKRS